MTHEFDFFVIFLIDKIAISTNLRQLNSMAAIAATIPSLTAMQWAVLLDSAGRQLNENLSMDQPVDNTLQMPCGK